jgi:hypothetical protein
MENLADKTIIYGMLQSDQRKPCKDKKRLRLEMKLDIAPKKK